MTTCRFWSRAVEGRASAASLMTHEVMTSGDVISSPQMLLHLLMLEANSYALCCGPARLNSPRGFGFRLQHVC